MTIQRVLVTGGVGYIGSHCCVELLKAGYDVTIADNLRNGSAAVVGRIRELAGKAPEARWVDLCDRERLFALLEHGCFDAVIHFAGLKAIGESIEKPLMYYENNLMGVINLCNAMQASGTGNLVFSSSAAVYGEAGKPPFDEDAPTSATNPYGRTKLFIEAILKDVQLARPDWNVSILRYFNPVGAHPDGLIGEAPAGEPKNLMPCICRAAAGRMGELLIYGDNYDTPDGTAVRDFIHVVDLARGHLAALARFGENPGYMVHNLGTGRGVSVMELLKTFERVNGVHVPHRFAPRRPGDVAVNYAAAGKAERELGWKATFGVEEMVRDAWRWQRDNPDGYPKD
ncbi:UDP-glucose 4-epimerase GalE [Salidesulfovibrio brasiliensis]|uniref:UDP-glucose 4-epimerase GalE n=1 Tax=Salidesulfovibrio brasiliensis TaxID=221711 RepID=UPI0006CF8D72|nr:UDP-glucose 4-epimerase GalE [Salidesulfovibrio brasiliensis]